MGRGLLERLLGQKGPREMTAPALSVLAHGTGKGVVVRLVSVAVLFFFNLYVARTLGDADAGIFFLGLSVVTSLAVIARFGLEGPVLRTSAALVKDRNWGELRADYFATMAFCLAVGLLFSVILYYASPWLANDLFEKPELEPVLRSMCLGLMPLAALIFHARYLRAIEHVGVSLAVQSTLVPAVFIVIALLPIGYSSAASLGLHYSIAAGLGLLWVITYWLRNVPLLSHKSTAGSFPAQIRSGRSLLVPSIMDHIVQPFAAILLLGYWGTAEEVGWFTVGNRLAALVSFALMPVIAIYSPRIAVLARDGDVGQMRDYTHAATKITLLIAAPMLIIIAFAADWLMAIFGPEFRAGAGLLVVLAVGQAINVVTGPVRAMLLMAARDRAYRFASIVGGAIGLLASVALIPQWGAIGAAWGTTAGVAGVNLISAYSVWKHFGILPVRLPGASVDGTRSGKDD